MRKASALVAPVALAALAVGAGWAVGRALLERPPGAPRPDSLTPVAPAGSIAPSDGLNSALMSVSATPTTEPSDAETAMLQAQMKQMEERLRAEIARDPLRRLQKLSDAWEPQLELVRSKEEFGAWFKRRTDGPVIDGASMSYSRPPADGTTIRFTAGKHALDVRAMSRWTPFPQDLVIEGAGMDATLLVGNDMLRAKGPVRNLTYRSLTMDTGDNDFQRIRPEPFTLRLDRCRVIGFDDGAGGSDMLSSECGAIFATDCRFEGGFGSAPGYGNLFDVRAAFLARLENCDMVGPFRLVNRSGNATQVFSNCRFTRMDGRSMTPSTSAQSSAEFTGCTFGYLAPGSDGGQRRSLAELNPAWADAKPR